MNERDLPNFLVIGAAKSGTTWLHEVLARHPDVFVPAVKEPAFFCNDHLWEHGASWYRHRYFSGAGSYAARGEATPQYLPSAVAPRRVLEVLGPAVRLVVVLRDPVQRAWSWYWHGRRNGIEALPFAEALEQEAARTRLLVKEGRGSLVFDYVRSGEYGRQLALWREVFSEDRFFVRLHEDVRQDPQRLVDELCDFLGVERRGDLLPEGRVNVASEARSLRLQRVLLGAERKAARWLSRRVPEALKGPIVRTVHPLSRRVLELNQRPRPNPELPPSLEADLRLRFRDDVERLQDLIGRDLSAWLPG